MFLVIMIQQQKDKFTHPQRFICYAERSELDRTLREHGYIGTYEAEELPYIISRRYQKN